MSRNPISAAHEMTEKEKLLQELLTEAKKFRDDLGGQPNFGNLNVYHEDGSARIKRFTQEQIHQTRLSSYEIMLGTIAGLQKLDQHVTKEDLANFTKLLGSRGVSTPEISKEEFAGFVGKKTSEVVVLLMNKCKEKIVSNTDGYEGNNYNPANIFLESSCGFIAHMNDAKSKDGGGIFDQYSSTDQDVPGSFKNLFTSFLNKYLEAKSLSKLEDFFISFKNQDPCLEARISSILDLSLTPDNDPFNFPEFKLDPSVDGNLGLILTRLDHAIYRDYGAKKIPEFNRDFNSVEWRDRLLPSLERGVSKRLPAHLVAHPDLYLLLTKEGVMQCLQFLSENNPKIKCIFTGTGEINEAFKEEVEAFLSGYKSASEVEGEIEMSKEELLQASELIKRNPERSVSGFLRRAHTSANLVDHLHKSSESEGLPVRKVLAGRGQLDGFQRDSASMKAGDEIRQLDNMLSVAKSSSHSISPVNEPYDHDVEDEFRAGGNIGDMIPEGQIIEAAELSERKNILATQQAERNKIYESLQLDIQKHKESAAKNLRPWSSTLLIDPQNGAMVMTAQGPWAYQPGLILNPSELGFVGGKEVNFGTIALSDDFRNAIQTTIAGGGNIDDVVDSLQSILSQKHNDPSSHLSDTDKEFFTSFKSLADRIRALQKPAQSEVNEPTARDDFNSPGLQFNQDGTPKTLPHNEAVVMPKSSKAVLGFFIDDATSVHGIADVLSWQKEVLNTEKRWIKIFFRDSRGEFHPIERANLNAYAYLRENGSLTGSLDWTDGAESNPLKWTYEKIREEFPRGIPINNSGNRAQLLLNGQPALFITKADIKKNVAMFLTGAVEGMLAGLLAGHAIMIDGMGFYEISPEVLGVVPAAALVLSILEIEALKRGKITGLTASCSLGVTNTMFVGLAASGILSRPDLREFNQSQRNIILSSDTTLTNFKSLTHDQALNLRIFKDEVIRSILKNDKVVNSNIVGGLEDGKALNNFKLLTRDQLLKLAKLDSKKIMATLTNDDLTKSFKIAPPNHHQFHALEETNETDSSKLIQLSPEEAEIVSSSSQLPKGIHLEMNTQGSHLHVSDDVLASSFSTVAIGLQAIRLAMLSCGLTASEDRIDALKKQFEALKKDPTQQNTAKKIEDDIKELETKSSFASKKILVGTARLAALAGSYSAAISSLSVSYGLIGIKQALGAISDNTGKLESVTDELDLSKYPNRSGVPSADLPKNTLSTQLQTIVEKLNSEILKQEEILLPENPLMLVSGASIRLLNQLQESLKLYEGQLESDSKNQLTKIASSIVSMTTALAASGGAAALPVAASLALAIGTSAKSLTDRKLTTGENDAAYEAIEHFNTMLVLLNGETSKGELSEMKKGWESESKELSQKVIAIQTEEEGKSFLHAVSLVAQGVAKAGRDLLTGRSDEIRIKILEQRKGWLDLLGKAADASIAEAPQLPQLPQIAAIDGATLPLPSSAAGAKSVDRLVSSSKTLSNQKV